MVGRLAGKLAGRPVVIEASDSELTIGVDGLRSAWRLRKIARLALGRTSSLATRFGVPVRLRIGKRRFVEVAPRPSLLARLVTLGWRR